MKHTRKKIIISSYDDLKNPVYSGGGAYSVHQLAKRLAKSHEITVLTGTYKNAKNEKIDNIQYLRVGSDMFGHKIGQLIYQYALLKYARKPNYDIWIEATNPPFTFSFLPLFAKKPIISWVHMICSYDMQRKYVLNLRFIEKALCELYKYIIVPTKWVKDEVKNMNKHAVIKSIPYGYNHSVTKTVEKNRHSNEKSLLFIGRIEVNQKGLDLLIQALSFSQSSLKTVIAGGGAAKEQKELRRLIKKYQVEDKVQLVGKVQGAKKEQLFREAKAVVIPSRYETFVTVALEAIIHQKPVICFNIPQNAWIPAKYAWKIKPFNTKSLTRAIDSLTSTKTSKKITLHDKKMFMKNFSWENFAKEFEASVAKIAI